MVDRAGLEGAKSLLHFVEAVGVAKENCEIKPGATAGVTGRDGDAVVALCAARIVVLRSDPGETPVRHRGIERQERLRLLAGFVLAAADDGWRFDIEFSEIGPRLPILWIEFNGALEGYANFLCQSGRRDESSTARLLSISATQPEMVAAVPRIEVAGAFTSGDTAVPLLNHEIRAAQ